MAASDDIFEISDFTVVTDWEKFTLQLETIIHEWQLNVAPQNYDPLPKGALNCAYWETKQSERVSFSSYNFYLTHYKLWDGRKSTSNGSVRHTLVSETGGKSGNFPAIQQNHVPILIRDLLDVYNDFPAASCNHELSRCYGLREFLVLCPVGKSDAVKNENLRNTVLSTIHMALSATNCEIPFFVTVTVSGSDRPIYSGVCQNHNVRTTFDMVHLKHSPEKFRHLAGLIDMFKEKVACPLLSPPPVKVAARVTYILQERFDSQWTQPLPDVAKENSLVPADMLSDTLPFGTFQDPVSQIRLSVSWPSVNEDMIVENDVYSDLDPVSAPYWGVAVAFQDGMECMMTEKLREFCDLSKCKYTVDAVLGIEDKAEAESALGKLTEAPVSRVVGGAMPTVTSRNSLEDRFPLVENVIEEWIERIFSETTGFQDSQEYRKSADEVEAFVNRFEEISGDPFVSATPGKLVSVRRRASDHSGSKSTAVDVDLHLNEIMDAIKNAKAAPCGSLTWRLTLAIARLRWSMQGVEAVCQLWRDIVMTLRDFWDRGELLPLMSVEHPNTGSCLLQQKLTMLQCCIEAKRKRRSLISSKDDIVPAPAVTDSDSEEFYECTEDDSTENMKECLEWLDEPEGRLEVFEDLKLLLHPSLSLYVPVTQDPGPLTEDMLEEQSELFNKLGTSAEGSAMRTKMQTSVLLSDMEAFKAANPKCCLEDFVRWHSPRDWIEEVDKETGELKGHLSERMVYTSDNIWHQLWLEARPVPVVRQKRLFNESKEAEKILHWLGSLTVSELCLLLLPCLFSVGLTQVCTEAKNVYELISDKLVSMRNKFIRATREQNVDHYLDLLKEVSWIEATVSQFRSVKSRFAGADCHCKHQINTKGLKVEEDELKNFVLDLMKQSEVGTRGGANGAFGHVVKILFENDVRVKKHGEASEEKKFPPPLFKEYILRWFIPRPAEYSRPSPQRMFACIHPGKEFMLAGAFSDDLTFM